MMKETLAKTNLSKLELIFSNLMIDTTHLGISQKASWPEGSRAVGNRLSS